MYQYNFRAEKLPKKYPTIKPKSNRFNMGIIEVALRDEYMGETFGDERMLKVSVLREHPLIIAHRIWLAYAQGISKRTEELPNHPDLRDAAPWDHSVELTPSTRKQHVRSKAPIDVFSRREDSRCVLAPVSQDRGRERAEQRVLEAQSPSQRDVQKPRAAREGERGTIATAKRSFARLNRASTRWSDRQAIDI